MAERQNLLAEQRRALILDEVRRRGGVRVNELTQRLGVSDMTVRRDLDALARLGALEKVHGGAVPVDGAEPTGHEPRFEEKTGREPAAKEEIARAAASLVAPGAAVALSGGTTTYALARVLAGVPDLTVVTNSVRVADVLHTARRSPDGAEAGGPTVVLTGGVRTPSDSLVGPVADRAIAALHFDLLFLGVHGISVEAGLSTPNLAEAETNRRLVASARRVVVVADHTKWGTVGLSSFASLSEVDVLVTDSGLPAVTRAELSELPLRLLVAGEDDELPEGPAEAYPPRAG
ncbi:MULTISPECIES: DeoR/GlpR family DNA-binding transcription regulator [Streptomyces]|uniref:DeoR/GlpR family DNA-binding transcription regulator n=1 Tax=Streptomyces TaxID=1883 RepID=UPI00140D04AC|nr:MULTISPECIES: DeoR/GlpR family DNA-binding transcription regulator [Streptomyces]MDH6228387.1 DeoR/GlpR family transcriptional regulator of sugar metabolism [Streptomyces sp. MJP52]